MGMGVLGVRETRGGAREGREGNAYQETIVFSFLTSTRRMLKSWLVSLQNKSITILRLSLSTGKVFNFAFISFFFNEIASCFTELFQNKPSLYNHYCRPIDTLSNFMSFRTTKRQNLNQFAGSVTKAVLHLDVDRRQCVGWRVLPRTDYAHVKIVPMCKRVGRL